MGAALTLRSTLRRALVAAAGLSAIGPGVAAQEAPTRSVLEVTGLGYALGRPDAPLHVVEFADMGCRECRRFAEETLPAIREEYIDTGRVYWQLIPYVSGLQPNGEEGSRAVECAAEQGAFWPMHDMLFARQTEWWTKMRPQRQYGRFAQELGLDDDRFGRCYRDRETVPRTERNTEAALAAGVRATPTFFVEGRWVLGALPVDLFREVLEQAAVNAGR